jgi:hypothetical protein
MINNDRIVPITACDLISMYGLILKQASGNSALAALEAASVDGQFEVGASAGSLLIANEPVKTLDFATGYTAGTVYFVPAYDYAGFTINDVAVTPTGTVEADGRTLYKAVLASSAVTITKVGF